MAQAFSLRLFFSDLTLSNPSIFNDKEASLANAAKQNTTDTNKVGALVVMNQPTGKYDGWWILSSLTSELMYAGYDKFNDTLCGKLPLTNSEKLNQDIYLDAMDKVNRPEIVGDSTLQENTTMKTRNYTPEMKERAVRMLGS